MKSIRLDALHVDWNNLNQFAIDFIETNRILVFAEDERTVSIAYVPGITGRQAMDRTIRHRAPREVIFYETTSDDLASVLARIGAEGSGPGRKLDGNGTDITALDKMANDAPVVNLVNSLILDALSSDSSDIHLEIDDGQMIVRYRIDGNLQIVKRYETEKFPAVSSRIKIMANLNILETRRPQDGRITVSLEGKEIHLRVSIVPLINGESIVLRLFRKENNLASTKLLGFPEPTLNMFKRVSQFPHGLILISGPTGSGKTTTLSAILSELRDESKKIITLEDPVEYVLQGVNQIPIREDIGMGFDSLLRRILRQDPDIIMVGEIRDPETANLAVSAALTGHLVFSTIHTNNAPSVVSRLVDMDVPSYMVGAVLRGVIAQRLIRLVCKECATPIKNSGQDKQFSENWNKKIGTIQTGKGCLACHESGFSGRTAISEWFTMNSKIERMIAEKEFTGEKFRKEIEKEGYVPMAVDGLDKAQAGITTINEVRRVTVEI